MDKSTVEPIESTPQLDFWRGPEGDAYTRRSMVDPVVRVPMFHE